MFDTYYYIDKMPELFVARGFFTYVTGGRFHPVPGEYTMPLGEGKVTIIGKGYEEAALIKMNTRGGAELYRHDFLDYLGPSMEYDSGWYRWFCDVCPTSTYQQKVVKIYLPRE
jgi:hypothetical protein